MPHTEVAFLAGTKEGEEISEAQHDSQSGGNNTVPYRTAQPSAEILRNVTQFLATSIVCMSPIGATSAPKSLLHAMTLCPLAETLVHIPCTDDNEAPKMTRFALRVLC